MGVMGVKNMIAICLLLCHHLNHINHSQDILFYHALT